jgi:hypothetical protein
VAERNKRSHQNNERLYDRKAKPRAFEVKDLLHFFSPAKKSGLTKKFDKPWHGPCQATRKISELNYEIAGQNNKKKIVPINRVKLAYILES